MAGFTCCTRTVSWVFVSTASLGALATACRHTDALTAESSTAAVNDAIDSNAIYQWYVGKLASLSAAQRATISRRVAAMRLEDLFDQVKAPILDQTLTVDGQSVVFKAADYAEAASNVHQLTQYFPTAGAFFAFYGIDPLHISAEQFARGMQALTATQREASATGFGLATPSLTTVAAAATGIGAVLSAVVGIRKSMQEAVELVPTPHSDYVSSLENQAAESQARADLLKAQAAEIQMRTLQATARAEYFAALRLSVQAQVDYQAWLARQSPAVKAAAADAGVESISADAPDAAEAPSQQKSAGSGQTPTVEMDSKGR